MLTKMLFKTFLQSLHFVEYEGIGRWGRVLASNSALKRIDPPTTSSLTAMLIATISTLTWPESKYVYQQHFSQITAYASAYIFHVSSFQL